MSDKMNKEAFTLIELLAVIVILAIISLIAVPIVINIINDSKKSSDEQSVELYLDNVKKAITKKQLNNPNFNPDKCEIQDNGDLKCYENNELIDTLQIEMKGKTPNKGKITILNNKFNYKNIWFNNKKYYAISTLLDDADNNNEISIGDKYSYKVNDKDTFTFYVLTEPEDGKVNLIMDRNICSDGTIAIETNPCLIAWHAETANSSFGPDTVMEGLYNATKNWNNVPDMDLSNENAYYDEGNKQNKSTGYGKIETIKMGIKITKKDNTESATIPYDSGKLLKARLPMKSEMDGAKCTEKSASCPLWLVNNLAFTSFYPKSTYSEKNDINGIYGYWLMSSRPGDSHSARNLYHEGDVDAGYVDTNNKVSSGIRPVITVPIDDLN